MAYEAHKWKIGEEITSEKLNHIEKGIEEAGLPREITDPQDGQTLKYDAASGKWVNGAGGGTNTLYVESVDDGTSTTLQKTWQEIYDAFPNVVVYNTYEEEGIEYVKSIDPILRCNGRADGPQYSVVIAGNNNGSLTYIDFTTTSPSGYPVTGVSESPK